MEVSKQQVINEAITLFRSSRINFGEIISSVQQLRKIKKDKSIEDIAKISSDQVKKSKEIVAALERGDIGPALKELEKYKAELPAGQYSEELRSNMKRLRRLYFRLKYYGQQD